MSSSPRFGTGALGLRPLLDPGRALLGPNPTLGPSLPVEFALPNTPLNRLSSGGFVLDLGRNGERSNIDEVRLPLGEPAVNVPEEPR